MSEKEIDGVKQPSYYQIMNMTVDDVIRKALTEEEYIGWLKGNVIKHRLRAGKKDALLKDIAKANEYEEFYETFLTKKQEELDEFYNKHMNQIHK